MRLQFIGKREDMKRVRRSSRQKKVPARFAGWYGLRMYQASITQHTATNDDEQQSLSTSSSAVDQPIQSPVEDVGGEVRFDEQQSLSMSSSAVDQPIQSTVQDFDDQQSLSTSTAAVDQPVQS